MDNTTYHIILKFGFIFAYLIDVVVLFHRTRVQATKLRKKTQKKEVEYVHLLKASFCQMMFAVNLLLSDSTNASKYGKALLDVYRECGTKAKEKRVYITTSRNI